MASSPWPTDSDSSYGYGLQYGHSHHDPSYDYGQQSGRYIGPLHGYGQQKYGTIMVPPDAYLWRTTIFSAISATRPRADVAYCIHALARRLAKTHNWAAERLSEFYDICKSLDIGRGERFIKIEQPPASFITAMEEYVKDAPRVSCVRKEVWGL
ncbi:putative clathrin assembly protein [Cinnamomum micranthum f. kanehirae]|uniref:Putative clathrin assembly protein n=1 Tax=Cinnamomum micranthum f. kanehirae TaxID=337451 RepID=A0A3S3PHY9_9MAGN|nr:putative clathrin assembly protein [Cinnamomum micranthum f. kanehirae]